MGLFFWGFYIDKSEDFIMMYTYRFMMKDNGICTIFSGSAILQV